MVGIRVCEVYVKLFQKLYAIPLNSFSRVKFRTYSLKVCPCSVLYLLIYYINYNNSVQSCQKHGPSLHLSIPEPGQSVRYSNSSLIFATNKWQFLSFLKKVLRSIWTSKAKKIDAPVKNIDYNPIEKQLMALDFQALFAGEKVSTTVAIKLGHTDMVHFITSEDAVVVHIGEYAAAPEEDEDAEAEAEISSQFKI